MRASTLELMFCCGRIEASNRPGSTTGLVPRCASRASRLCEFCVTFRSLTCGPVTPSSVTQPLVHLPCDDHTDGLSGKVGSQNFDLDRRGECPDRLRDSSLPIWMPRLNQSPCERAESGAVASERGTACVSGRTEGASHRTPSLLARLHGGHEGQ